MSIIVNNLNKVYGTQRALFNVSFEVNKGEILGLLGPNGAGKSTLMKILTGSISQTSGDAKICTLDIKKNSLETRSKIGYLPEHNPLYLDMYVKEYLEFIANTYKANHKFINEVIEKTGLQKEQNKLIGSLSKGYRQRVGLAQALLHNPEVLILDEPTTGLDPNQLVEIRSLIKEIGKEKTVILSTHIMQEVEAICDKVLLLNNGKVVANNLVKEIIKTEKIEDFFRRLTFNSKNTSLIKDKKSIKLNTICFFIPLVGLILYLIQKNEFPLKTKSAFNSAVLGFILNLIFWIYFYLQYITSLL